MEREVEARFERIEKNLERMGDSMSRFAAITTDAIAELNDAHKNTAALLRSSIEESNVRSARIDEKLERLEILVDQLIRRDMER